MDQQLAIAVWFLSVKIVSCFKIRIGSAYRTAACNGFKACNGCFRFRIGSTYEAAACYSCLDLGCQNCSLF
jgi:hypothetical protein